METRAEGSTPDDQEGFDEGWYLAQNPAIAEAVRQGHFLTGWDHYNAHGRREGLMHRPGLQPIGGAGGETLERPPFWEHNGVRFLTPSSLAVTETRLTRVAMLGSCLLEGWGFHRDNPGHCPVDLYTLDVWSGLPDVAPDVLASYDFLILQIPSRYLQPDDAVWHLAYADRAGHEEALRSACDVLEKYLHAAMLWNREHGLLTFVANFLVPQQNPMGRLLPRFDPRNPEYFVTRLNEHLEKTLDQYKNAHVLDLDRLSASVGRRHTQDDATHSNGHGAFIPIGGEDANRIEPIGAMSAYFDVRWWGLLPDMIWAETVALYRTVRQTDMVKLVVVDLDDTLWRGVSGDMAEGELPTVEGWPLGLVEALQYLRKRGILLAIISKNDEGRVRDIWPRIFNGGLLWEEFAAIRINWKPKPENMREILTGMNLLPGNVVFIDDNPAERAAMREAFPEIRVLGRHPYYLKPTLLWSPETQVPHVTEESGRRTEMIQAQFRREETRETLPREEFLRRAAPEVTLSRIGGAANPRFPRVLELINKTNQFNTTGRRWTAAECEAWISGGGTMLSFEVTDHFSHYGLVGVVLARDNAIEQWVMSCRVLGYRIEEGVMAVIVGRMRETGATPVTGRLVRTNVNFPCQDLFARCGFVATGEDGQWVLPAWVTPPAPDHLRFGQDASRPAAASPENPRS